MTKRARLIGVACIAGLALAACGSSSSGSGGKTLSKAEFVKEAEAICKAGEAKVQKATAGFSRNPTLAQIKTAYVDTLVPLFRDEISDLRALDPPAADRDEINQMLDDLSSGVDEAADAIADVKSQADLEKLAEPAGLKKASAEAKAYGLPTCGED